MDRTEENLSMINMTFLESIMADPIVQQLNREREALESRYNLLKHRYWALRRTAAAIADVTRCSNRLGIATLDLPLDAHIAEARVAAQAVLDEFHTVCAQMSARIDTSIRIGGAVERTVPLAANDADIRATADAPH